MCVKRTRGARPHRAREQIDQTSGKPRRVRGDGLLHAGAGLERGSGADRGATPRRIDVSAAVKATEIDGAAKPLGTRTYATTPIAAAATPLRPTCRTASRGRHRQRIYATKPAPSVTVALSPANATASGQRHPRRRIRRRASAAAPAIAREAAWLYRNGWPLYALVDRYGAGAPLDEQAHCIAVAVYHEARGESLEGQLAVARVIMNRAASGKYPPSWCGTVKQPWQFSFVNPRTGQYAGGQHQLGGVAQGAGDHPPGDRQCGAEPVERRAVVPRRLCRSVVGPPPELRAEDRHAHLLPLLILGPGARASSVRR